MKALSVLILAIPVPIPGFHAPRFRGSMHPSHHIPSVEWTRHDEAFLMANVMIGPMDASLHEIARQVTAAFAAANENSRQHNALVIEHAQRLLYGGRIKKAMRISYARNIQALDGAYFPLHSHATEIWTRFEVAARAAHPALAEIYRIVFDGTEIGWNGCSSMYDDTGEWYPPAPFEQRLVSRASLRHHARKGAMQ